jgi:hypothetical protein
MSRFDPSKLEWPHGETGALVMKGRPADPTSGISPISVEIVPGAAYRDLHAHAEAMALELTAWCSCPCQMPEDEQCEACRLVARFRGEGQDAE